MWRDYSTWERDIEESYGSQLGDLEQRFRLGRGISPEAYAGERTRLIGAREQELQSLRGGITYQMLRENWEAQGAPGTMVEFYGGPSPRPREDTGQPERRPSPRRGLASGLPTEGESLLERGQATWYFV